MQETKRALIHKIIQLAAKTSRSSAFSKTTGLVTTHKYGYTLLSQQSSSGRVTLPHVNSNYLDPVSRKGPTARVTLFPRKQGPLGYRSHRK